MPRFLIVQPYVPRYRVPFFRALRLALNNRGIDLIVASGQPHGASALRDDDAGLGGADTLLDERVLSLAGRSVHIKSVSKVVSDFRPEYILVEQAIKNAEAYPLLLRQTLKRGPRVGMWGQGRTFSTSQIGLARGFKDWLTCRSDWFFAYTNEGADHVVAHGYDRRRVTVVNNTIDTNQLRADLSEVTAKDLADFIRANGLTRGQTALFLGGVDESKGIDFLLATARRIGRQLPAFRLVIAGAGKDANLVRRRQLAGDPISYLGRAEGKLKALALKASDIMMIPQWVGLVAIDSFVAGRPIVTTRHASHSPEFGYLVDERNAFVSNHEIDAYSARVVECLQDADTLAKAQAQARLDSLNYSLDSMVERFAEGVLQWIGRG